MLKSAVSGVRSGEKAPFGFGITEITGDPD